MDIEFDYNRNMKSKIDEFEKFRIQESARLEKEQKRLETSKLKNNYKYNKMMLSNIKSNYNGISYDKATKEIEKKTFKTKFDFEYFDDLEFEKTNEIDDYEDDSGFSYSICDDYNDNNDYDWAFEDIKTEKNKILINEENNKDIKNKNQLVIKNNNNPLWLLGLIMAPSLIISGLQALSLISLSMPVAIWLCALCTPIVLPLYFIFENLSSFGVKSRIKKEIKKTELLLNLFSKDFNLKKDLILTQTMNEQFLLNTLLIDSSDKFHSIDLVVINDKLKNIIKVIEDNMIEKTKDI